MWDVFFLITGTLLFVEFLCDKLRTLVIFAQFKKREKTPMEQCYSNTPQWVFFTLFKLYKYYQIAQRIYFLKSTEKASVL